jgi:uncharacterized Zn finger protein (UPF0148 family)
MCYPRNPLVRERLAEPDASCDTCGVPLFRGEDVMLNHDSGKIFCSVRCGNIAHQIEQELRRRKRTTRTLATIGV